MSICDFFEMKPRKVRILDETLRGQLVDSITADLTGLMNASDPKVYAVSSFGVTLTFSDKKMKKYNIRVIDGDPLIFHSFVSNTLKRFTAKHIKELSGVLYVDFGDKDNRYHLHGYFYGVTSQLLRFVNYCRRNFGFAYIKPLFAFPEWDLYCKKNNSGLEPIGIFKAKRRSTT